MPARPKISLLACVCAVILAGCGSSEDGTIPPANSARMITLLTAVEKNAGSGDCELAQQQADEFKREVDLLPAEVDDEVKQGLFDAAANLIDLAQSECVDQGASGETGVQPTTQTSTTSVPATTQSATTTEPSTSTEPGQTSTNTGGGGPPPEPPTPEPPTGGGGGGGPTSGGIGGEKGTR